MLLLQLYSLVSCIRHCIAPFSTVISAATMAAEDCQICLSEMVKGGPVLIHRMRCMHEFHYECIENFSAVAGHGRHNPDACRCPICRMTERDFNQVEEDLFRADTILDDCLRAQERASSSSCTEPASMQALEAELDAAIRFTIENNTRYAKRKRQEAAETEAKYARHSSSSDS